MSTWKEILYIIGLVFVAWIIALMNGQIYGLQDLIGLVGISTVIVSIISYFVRNEKRKDEELNLKIKQLQIEQIKQLNNVSEIEKEEMVKGVLGMKYEINYKEIMPLTQTSEDRKPVQISEELYKKGCDALVSENIASTSYLQRKLDISYAQAAKLMDMLEEKGVISSANGSKPREVIIKN